MVWGKRTGNERKSGGCGLWFPMGPSALCEGFLSHHHHHHYYHSQLMPEAVVAIPISRTSVEQCVHRSGRVRTMPSSSSLAASAARMSPHACITSRISSGNGLSQLRDFPRSSNGFRHQLLQNDDTHFNSSIRCTIEVACSNFSLICDFQFRPA